MCLDLIYFQHSNFPTLSSLLAGPETQTNSDREEIIFVQKRLECNYNREKRNKKGTILISSRYPQHSRWGFRPRRFWHLGWAALNWDSIHNIICILRCWAIAQFTVAMHAFKICIITLTNYLSSYWW